MINSFLNYTGSKYKLLPQLLPHFDYTKNTFIDMFAGGTFCLSNVYCEQDLSCNAPIVRLCLEYGFKMVKLNHSYQKVAKNKNKIQLQEIIIKNYD